ncbi:ScyD/ScyE family protein [Microlunatus flavus]|uniref:ScyD/ScyE family protein n=1 Tax=Microlunatus flavus TaxID=1036181 RepID=UPI00147F2E9C|nr:ScyD/ScyE family protein [Microlunatus flavus]
MTVVASGLEGPRQLSAKDGYLYVAESDAARATRVRLSNRAKRVVVRDVPNAQGVTKIGSRLYLAAGETPPDVPVPPVKGETRLYVAKPFAKPRVFANPYAFELKYNPDNQTQFGPDGKPLDAISNPYFLIPRRGPGFALMAGAGGNDVLAVSKKGKLTPFFVPSAITTGDCAKQKQNSDAGPSCDPVPTGLAYGPKSLLYVSGLSSEVPGEGRVYVVDKNGKLVKTLTGFDSPTGVAVAPDGTIYVSEALAGLAGPPPIDDTVGRIVKVAPDGKRTVAQVSQPTGLLWSGGKLYASTRALYGAFNQQPGKGQVVSVDLASFK